MEELLIGLRLGLRCGISKKVYEFVFVIDWKVIDVETSFGSIRRRVAGKSELNYWHVVIESYIKLYQETMLLRNFFTKLDFLVWDGIFFRNSVFNSFIKIKHSTYILGLLIKKEENILYIIKENIIWNIKWTSFQ